MGTFVGHEACPACGSNDNLARYDDGSGYCFGCEYHEKAGGGVTNGSAEKTIDRRVRSGTGDSLLTGDVRALGKRGITEETCRHFDYRVGRDRGRTVQIANYRRDGRVIAQKVRDASKKFRVIGDGKRLPLYGQWLWRDGGRRLIITEGEIDALSVSQLQGNKWPVVSVPNGAQGAAKTIAREIEWIEKFDAVVFAFDMDEPGQEAAQECAELLSAGKAYIAHLPAKDANEALLAGKGKQLISALWDARRYSPEGVVSVADIIEDAMKPIELGRPWPFERLTRPTYGRRRGEVYGFGGGTGCGKTTSFKQIMSHVLTTEDTPVAGILLEEAPKLTLRTIGGMIMGKRVHVPGVEFDENELRATMQSLDGKLFLYDHFGGATWDTVKSKIRYYAHLGCRDIFVDHLTALAATIDDDERRAIDKMMADLSSLAKHLDICLYYISHLTTPDGKPHEEGGRVLEKHFRGSRSIGYWSHFLFAIERDKQDPESLTTFRVLKDRYTGDATGLTFGLDYDRETGTYAECDLPDEDAEGWKPTKREEDF